MLVLLISQTDWTDYASGSKIDVINEICDIYKTTCFLRYWKNNILFDFGNIDVLNNIIGDNLLNYCDTFYIFDFNNQTVSEYLEEEKGE